jgi:hypothetical protein
LGTLLRQRNAARQLRLKRGFEPADVGLGLADQLGR